MRPQKYSKADVLSHALQLATDGNYQRVTREQLAAAAGCSPGQVSAMFGTMCQLRRAIVSAAIARGCAAVIAQAIVAGEPKAKALPRDRQLEILEASL